MRDFFVVPNVVELSLFPGETPPRYIEVKERLTFAEQEMLKSASLTSVNFNAQRAEDGDTEIGLDMKRHAILRLMIWITGWNLPDHTGKTMALNKSAIENLHPEVAAEINRVLDEHILGMEGNASTPSLALVPDTTS